MRGGPAPGDLYWFAPDLAVQIRGNRRARAHFRAEYGVAARASLATAPALEATIGTHVDSDGVGRGSSRVIEGAHKLARWRALVPLKADGGTIRIAVDVRGPLGLMLVQSYVLEPMLSLAAVQAGSVLLPSAAIVIDGKALLLIGRSRSGKSSLAARALAAGRRILGDDQVLINAHQQCLRFPRRLRLYPDLARTAPAAFAALPSSDRRALAVLRRVDAMTRGVLAPPRSVSVSALAAGDTESPLPIGEVVVIRRASVDMLRTEALDRSELAADIDDALTGQRSGLFSPTGTQTETTRLLAEERGIIASALAAAPARRISVPASWTGARAVGALTSELGIER